MPRVYHKHDFGTVGTAKYKMLTAAFSRASKLGLEFNLTKNDIVIPKVCPLLGIPLVNCKGRGGRCSPSLDRINNLKGYTRENVWVISQRANLLKSDMTLEQFKAFLNNWQNALAASPKRNKLVYLASPYTHSDKTVEERRYRDVLEAWIALTSTHIDLFFFSPILHSHPLTVHGGVPGNWEFWAGFDHALISKSDEVWILCLPGFEKSVGVNAEKKLAQSWNMPIRYVNPNTYAISLDAPPTV